MKKHFNIRIKGKVQGVFFRGSTKEKGDALDISGFVRNEPDGTVYIEAEGEEENLRNFIQWCRRGPKQARVENCEVKEAALVGFGRFVIEH
jgi:acylphosphatase